MGKKEFFRRAQGGRGLQAIVPTDDPEMEYVSVDLLRASGGEQYEFGAEDRELGINMIRIAPPLMLEERPADRAVGIPESILTDLE